MTKTIGILLLIVGFGLIGYALPLEPYTDKDAFYEEMYALYEHENKSQAYFELRESYLTPKYTLENYALIAITLGLYILILIPKNWRDFKTPKSKIAMVSIGVLAVLFSIVSYVGSLYLDAIRDAFPPWADSLGIPLMSAPFLFCLFSGWFAINLIGLIAPFRTAVSITEFRFKKANYWYLALIGISVFFLFYCIYYNDFWGTATNMMWIYFYLSLFLGRMKELENH